MGFRVEIAEVIKAIEALSKATKTVSSQLDTAKDKTNAIISSGALYGRAGDAVYNQLNNYDAALHVGLADALTVLGAEFAATLSEFQETIKEHHASAVLDEETLTDLKTKLTTVKTKRTSLEEGITGIYQEVDDLVDFKATSEDTLSSVRDAKKILQDAKEHVASFEGAQKESGTKNLLDTFQTVLQSLSQVSDLSYSDRRLQYILGNPEFGTSIYKMDGELQDQIEQAEKDQKEAQKKAEKEAEEDWKKRHPVQAFIRGAKDGANAFLDDVADSTLGRFTGIGTTAGFLQGAVEMVGGIAELGASYTQFTLEATHYLQGTAKDWEKADIMGATESFKTLGQMAIWSAVSSTLPGASLMLKPAFQAVDESGALDKVPIADDVTSFLADSAELSDRAGKQMVDGIIKAFQENPNQAAGRAAFEIASLIFPATKAGTAAEGANLAGKVAKGVDTASDVARGADMAGDLARGADTASDLGRLAEGADTLSDLSRVAGFGDELTDASKLTRFTRGVEAVKDVGRSTKGLVDNALTALTERVRSIEIPLPGQALATEGGSLGRSVRVGDVLDDAGRGMSRMTGSVDDASHLAGKTDDTLSVGNQLDDLGDAQKVDDVAGAGNSFASEKVTLKNNEIAYKSADLADGEPVLVRSPKYLDDTGHIKWPDADGFVTDSAGNPITEPANLKAGQVIDRYGGNGGRFTSPVENGKILDYDTRGLPYPEGYQPYHQYEVVKDITKENIEVGFSKLSSKDQQLLLAEMRRYGKTFNDLANPKIGKIAKVFGQGGGTQIQFESSVKWYEKMGLLKEVV